MEIAGVHEKATAFDGAAAVYEQARPGYPAAAVGRLVEALGLGPGRRVVDLAAGTGKLTRELVASGAAVIAVEPVAGMRERVAATSPSAGGGPAVSVVGAVAQALPVGGGLVDAVTVAQAFHWFATDEALAEIHRVLRPGGRLALMWNSRDEADPLQAALTDLMEPHRHGTPSHESGVWRQVMASTVLFNAAEEFHVAWRQPADIQGVADRVASVSFIAALPDGVRRELLDQVRAAAAATSPPVSLAYTADVYVYRAK